MDSDASAVLSGNPFSPGGLNSPDSAYSFACGDEDDVSEALLSSLPPHFISTLTALQEQLLTDLPATDSLDAFLNLDMMLDQDMTFDETGEVNLPNITDKIIYSPLGSESFPTKLPALTDIYRVETTARDVSNELITPSLFEKTAFDSLLSSTYNPSLNPGQVISQGYRKAVTLECAQKESITNGSNIRSNLLSIETTASLNIDSCAKRTAADRQAVSKKDKSAGVKKAKEKRKSKFSDLEDEAKMLILANEKLRQKIAELEKMTKEMKMKLVASIAGKCPSLN
ncbi:hypothetical protein BsWGS_09403 [Bradybaena similaris]